jgi:hypothetical protein
MQENYRVQDFPANHAMPPKEGIVDIKKLFEIHSTTASLTPHGFPLQPCQLVSSSHWVPPIIKKCFSSFPPLVIGFL